MDHRRVSQHMPRPSRRVAGVTGVAVAALTIAVGSSCTRNDPNSLLGGSTSTASSSSGTGGPSGTTTSSSSSGATVSSSSSGGVGGGGGAGGGAALGPDTRIVSYTDAFRSASFKIVGDAPTLAQMYALTTATDPQTTYEGMIDTLLADPRFGAVMVEFWQNAFRMRDDGAMPNQNAAPNYAAELTVNNGSIFDLLTQTDPTKTCPSFDATTATFTDGTCPNAASLMTNNLTPVGILTDPGVMKLYYGNLAFRRNRFYHETFICRSAVSPAAEPTATPGPNCPVAGYGSPWDFNSLTGLIDTPGPVPPAAPIDFQHAEANGVICANCHATWNHRAPLWANFDNTGTFQSTIQVHTPIVNLPISQLTDWLPPGQGTAWKFNMPAASLAALGTVMAADPEVQACTVARMWNYAMSRGDIVETGNTVAASVTAPLVTQLLANNNSILTVLRGIFKSDDFVKWGQPPATDTPPAGQPLPLDIASRMHGCQKVGYTALGTFLAGHGVNLALKSTPPSAGQLYAGATGAFGVPQPDTRTREPSFLTTSGATKMFDIFMQAALEIIPNIGTPALAPDCTVNGANSPMFDSSGACVQDSVSCLIGRPATPDDLILCNLILAKADPTNPADVATKQQIAVATMLSAAHTCE
jgi:hypothetical protein